MNESGFVDVDGISTHYFEAGQGEPLLLLHGSSFGEPDASAQEWEPVFHRFARDFRVLAIDKIGQGLTDNPKEDSDYLIGATVDHACAFIRALGLDQCHVVGHSRGGYTVCRMALEHPELTASIVIVDSGTLMGPSDDFYDNLARQVSSVRDLREVYRLLIEANSFSDEHVTDEMLDTIVELSRLTKMVEAASKMGPGPLPASGSTVDKASVGTRFLRDIVEKREETHAWIRAGGLRVPTLVIWGRDDPSAPLARHGLDCMNLILPNNPESQMHVLGQAGHYCFREQPQAFVAAVTGFIRSI